MDRDADERARQSGEARADDIRLASLRQQLYVFGTLMSFGIALLGGVAVSEFIRAAEVCAEPPEQPIRRVEDNPKNTNASSHSNPLAARLSAPAEAGRDAAVPDPCPPGVLRTASHPLPVLMTVDTGVDDALAILLALHARQEIKLLGIATVDGNTSADQAALNTLYLLERFGCAAEVSVVAGADKPLRRAIPKPVPEIHGVDGLGGVTTDYWRGRAEQAKAEVRRHDAVEFILDAARKHGPQLTIVSTAALTNIALAIRKDPAVMRRVGKLEIMGGAFERCNKKIGNITDFAEFNIYCDPEACDVALNSGIPITLYPLDVSEEVHLLKSTLAPDLGVPPEELALIKAMSKTYMDFHFKNHHFQGSFMHDALPISALMDRSLFAYRTGDVVVDCSDGPRAGQTRWAAPGEKGARVEVAMNVDEKRFLRFLWDMLKRPTVVCRPIAESP